jgi:redox-sensitive bicupin YhaK (pirin superfamily)
VQPGQGYPPHPHRDVEIVTWVLSGTLRHEDSTGRGGLVTAGLVQRLSAGSGVVHSEVNGDPAGTEPVHFVQMWVRPDEPGLVPAYDQREVDLGVGAWRTLASGTTGEAAVRLASRAATLLAARVAPGRPVELPDAPLLHLFVARGSVEVEGVGGLEAGDALRLFGGGGHRVTVPVDEGASQSELLLWAQTPHR